MLKTKLKFIGIGAYKSGTTWLVQCLREHPDVCIPKIKELEFFSKKYKNGKYLYSNYKKGMMWYEAQFSECDKSSKWWGEFSNAYLYDKDAPMLIKQNFPKIKLLLCLRNPVDRTYSAYLWDKLNFNIDKSKSRIIDKMKSGDYIEQSFYGKYVANYVKVFDNKNIHIILFDDIVEKPKKVIDEVCRFLDISEFTPPTLNIKVNPASKARFKTLTYFFELRNKIEENNLGIIIDFLKKLHLYNSIQNFYVFLNRKPIIKKKLTKDEREQLKKLFINDLVKTEGLLKIDLSKWK